MEALLFHLEPRDPVTFGGAAAVLVAVGVVPRGFPPILPPGSIGDGSARRIEPAPFFIGGLVGVGCRLMERGPSLGTLAGTLEPTPMCAY